MSNNDTPPESPRAKYGHWQKQRQRRRSWLASLLSLGGCVIACQTPPILAPTKDKQGCNPNLEVDCRSGGCCAAEVETCGPDDPTCPAGQCCPTGEQPDTYGSPKKRLPHPQRQP